MLYDLGYVSTCEPFGRLVNQGYILADAFTDERGMYVPAAEVTTAADGTARYQGQPVTRRSGKMGKSLKNGVSPDQIYQPLRRGHAAAAGDGDGPDRGRPGRGGRTTSPACTGSCSGCGGL